VAFLETHERRGHKGPVMKLATIALFLLVLFAVAAAVAIARADVNLWAGA
jgi:uncharacterized protein YraI